MKRTLIMIGCAVAFASTAEASVGNEVSVGTVFDDFEFTATTPEKETFLQFAHRGSDDDDDDDDRSGRRGGRDDKRHSDDDDGTPDQGSGDAGGDNSPDDGTSGSGRDKPRIPGGSGCDDPGDVAEHAECSG